ncbi:MAG: SIS domain-containing protein, partial [Gemmatimonadales bacterium]
VGVASTKAFTSALTALYLLALSLGRRRGLSLEQGRAVVKELMEIPAIIARALETEPQVRKVASCLAEASSVLYLGRGPQFPVALEGALKLKEISYIHAEGYPAAEMKHGPIALIEEGMPVVVLAPRDASFPKVLSNMREVKARGASVIAITSEGNSGIAAVADHHIEVPAASPLLAPLLTVIPLQLLAYHVALLRGCDVDRPRNLAKSVTVE